MDQDSYHIELSLYLAFLLCHVSFSFVAGWGVRPSLPLVAEEGVFVKSPDNNYH